MSREEAIATAVMCLLALFLALALCAIPFMVVRIVAV